MFGSILRSILRQRMVSQIWITPYDNLPTLLLLRQGKSLSHSLQGCHRLGSATGYACLLCSGLTVFALSDALHSYLLGQHVTIGFARSRLLSLVFTFRTSWAVLGGAIPEARIFQLPVL